MQIVRGTWDGCQGRAWRASRRLDSDSESDNDEVSGRAGSKLVDELGPFYLRSGANELFPHASSPVLVMAYPAQYRLPWQILLRCWPIPVARWQILIAAGRSTRLLADPSRQHIARPAYSSRRFAMGATYLCCVWALGALNTVTRRRTGPWSLINHWPPNRRVALIKRVPDAEDQNIADRPSGGCALSAGISNLSASYSRS